MRQVLFNICKKYLHNYTYRVIIMQNHSKIIHGLHPHSHTFKRMGGGPGIQENL